MSELGEVGPAPKSTTNSTSPSRTNSPSRQLLTQPPPDLTSTTTRPKTPPPLPVTMSKERSVPKIEPRLSGQQDYAQWILSIKQTLSSHTIRKTPYGKSSLEISKTLIQLLQERAAALTPSYGGRTITLPSSQ